MYVNRSLPRAWAGLTSHLNPSPSTTFCPSEHPNQKPQHLDIIRSWITGCIQEHGEKCKPRKEDTEDGPSWLIDLQAKCLTEATKEMRYIALSYVWGEERSGMLKTLRHNFASLKRINGLEQFMGASALDCRVSHTVEDAMAIGKLLGFGYLWVDALCIVQDDPSHLERELPRMGEIYSGAELTLVAAQGAGSTHGIHFLHFTTTEALPNAEPLDPTVRETSDYLVDNASEAVALNRRKRWGSWSPLGRRYWLEKTQKQRDNLPIKNAALHIASPHPIVQPPQTPPGYNPTLALLGSTWLSRGWTMQELFFSKRILYFTDHGPMWECQCVNRDLGRSQGSTLCSKIPTLFHNDGWPDLDFYAGFVLDYNCRNLTHDADVLNAMAGITNTLSKVFTGGFIHGLPVLIFHKALLWWPDSSESLTPRKSDPKLHDSLQLPSWSWISMKGSLNLDLYSAADDTLTGYHSTGGFLTTHRSLHIVPIVDFKIEVDGDDGAELLDVRLSYDRRVLSPRLHFRTQRAFFTYNLFYHARTCELHSRTGNHGVIGRLSFDIMAENRKDTEIAELISISTGSCRSSDHIVSKRFGIEGNYEFYNVLIIRREGDDGVASRVGIGQVQKAGWEGARVEIIDVILA